MPGEFRECFELNAIGSAVNKALSQLGMLSPNRLANEVCDSELQRERNSDTSLYLYNGQSDGMYFLFQ